MEFSFRLGLFSQVLTQKCDCSDDLENLSQPLIPKWCLASGLHRMFHLNVRWLLKLFLWRNDRRYFEAKMTCHWSLGLLSFCLTSHQLSASTQFCWVEISLWYSLNLSCLIIPNKVHLSGRRLHCDSYYFLFSRVGDHIIWYGRDGSIFPWRF